jgi:lipopolysaccharide export system permease protein
MNGILSQYMMRAIITTTALVLLVLLALAGLFDFIGELDDIRGGYQSTQVVLFTLLQLPLAAFSMMPLAALIGSLLALGGLAAHSEIIVMRASGLSVKRLAGMVSITGAVLLVFTGLVGEFIGPPLDYYARNMRQEARSGKNEERAGNETWVKDGPVIMHLERVSTEFEFGRIYLFRMHDDNTLDSITTAENSGIDDDDRWVLENVRETKFQNDGVQVVESARAVESFDIGAETLGISLVKPQNLSGRGLWSYIRYLQRNSLDAGRYETELWYRIARTATIMIMPILALAFVFGSVRSGGAGARLMVGIVIGLAYYLSSELLANSGEVFNLNPAVIAWLPSVTLGVVTLIALNRIR